MTEKQVDYADLVKEFCNCNLVWKTKKTLGELRDLDLSIGCPKIGKTDVLDPTKYYIFLENKKLPDNECFFCNDTGGFVPLNQLNKFLDEEPKGIITSMLEVKRC